MKKLVPAVLMMLVTGCATVSKEQMASVDYGPRPALWKEEIRSYLGIRLTDPTAALIEFRNEPQHLFQRKTVVRAQQWGWAVCVWVNDKNRAGAYNGFYPMSFVLRNEKIAAVNGGPDDAGLVGERYAREQCAQLGAPFIQLR